MVAACLELPELTIIMTVAILLFLVAVGVYLIVNSSMIYGSYTTLLEEGEYTVEAIWRIISPRILPCVTRISRRFWRRWPRSSACGS